MKVSATMLAPAMITRLRRIATIYDIIHIHHPDPMATLALFLSGYKGKVILHWHSDIIKQKKLLKLYSPLQNWLIERADLIVGTTPVYVQHSAFLKEYQHKINYIPIGVLPIYSTSSLVEKINKDYLGKKLIFSLGRLVEYKGFEYLINAAKYLPDSYQIIIGGKGPLKKDLEYIISENKLGDKVKLLGFLSDEEAFGYFHACDMYCLSSIQKTEAFAIVQIEAMSCGKPIITANIPESGVSWVNQHLESGLICKAKSSEDIARSISLIGDNIELYDKLSKGALSRFEKQFHRDVMINKAIQLYSEILVN